MSMDAQDFRNSAASSSCCGAAILDPDICEECGEHCEDDNAERGPISKDD